MIANTKPNNRRRPAATVVETALVISLFLMFMFGIFEYSRYIMFLQVSTNALRDAARYACVNVDKPPDFPTNNFTQGTTTYLSISNYTQFRLAGMQNMLDAGWVIEVFPCDQAQLDLPVPVVAPKGGSIGATVWNQASFTERICVRLRGNYRMLLPQFLFSNSINVNIAAVSASEG